MRSVLACSVMLLSIGCATGRAPSALRLWDGGSESMPVVTAESADPSFEVVMTTRHPGIEIPRIRQELNAYGRMNVTVWVRTTGRAQEMVEVKAKFFNAVGALLEATADWTQVFVPPGEAKQVDLLCAEEGAATFKVLVR